MDLFDNNALNMPMVALRGLVVFPNITLHFDVGRKKSISAVKTAMITKQDIFLSTQKDMSDEAENIDAVYDIGVVCEIKQIVRIPSSDCLRVIVEGKYRAELLAFSDVNPYLTAVVKRIDSIPYSEKYNLRAEALVRYAKGLFNEYSVIAQKLPNDINMGVAKLSALRSKDPNTQVGACIVSNDNKILSMGYNGLPIGCSDDEFPWCREGDPLDNKYFYTTHSELNAILNYRGGTLDGAKMYVTLFPCNECAKAIIQAGIKTIVYDCDKYADTASVIASKRMLNAAGVRYYKYESDKREVTLQL